MNLCCLFPSLLIEEISYDFMSIAMSPSTVLALAARKKSPVWLWLASSKESIFNMTEIRTFCISKVLE